MTCKEHPKYELPNTPHAKHRYESAMKNVEAAKAALHTAIVEISKAGSKGVYHKNTCSRKISRLTKAVNGIA